MIKITELASAIADHDFAKRAASYGGGMVVSRDVLCHAIMNLPSVELVAVRLVIDDACKSAVKRTEGALERLGIELDGLHPFDVRAGSNAPK